MQKTTIGFTLLKTGVVLAFLVSQAAHANLMVSDLVSVAGNTTNSASGTSSAGVTVSDSAGDRSDLTNALYSSAFASANYGVLKASSYSVDTRASATGTSAGSGARAQFSDYIFIDAPGLTGQIGYVSADFIFAWRLLAAQAVYGGGGANGQMQVSFAGYDFKHRCQFGWFAAQSSLRLF